jgi:hypothetical protein
LTAILGLAAGEELAVPADVELEAGCVIWTLDVALVVLGAPAFTW